MTMRFFVVATLCLFCAGGPSVAQDALVFQLMEDAIPATPAAEIARADIERSKSVGEQLVAGPYEFELTASGGYRRVEAAMVPDMGYSEWSLDLTRAVRLPEKRQVDRALASVEQDIAAARRELSFYEERLAFVGLWNEWARWAALTETSSQLADSAHELTRLAQARVDAGSGRQVEADLLAAEARALQLIAGDDRLRVEAARAGLLQRYPGLSLPEAPPRLDLGPDRVAAMLAQSDAPAAATRQAALEAERARLLLRRSNAERRPDPTFGVGLRNEFGGDETAIVASVSIPLGGRSRSSRVSEASAVARLAEAEQRRRALDLDARILEARHRYDRSDRLLAGAKATLDLTASALDRMQAGYDLGEVRLDEIIPVRRRLAEAARVLAGHETERQAAYLDLAVLLDVECGSTELPD
ncbi:TolC family protein [Hyphomonas sp. WL0036]|uniref:TolC family protein n=1 Tax=Hyphomonas sediminis TaxID=2866160 RepID=UPI001C816915|nr:TolC family protein [Hyphomonas sediminis]MBY9068213.1 TolC family protein [Hyphomonas sediminis]